MCVALSGAVRSSFRQSPIQPKKDKQHNTWLPAPATKASKSGRALLSRLEQLGWFQAYLLFAGVWRQTASRLETLVTWTQQPPHVSLGPAPGALPRSQRQTNKPQHQQKNAPGYPQELASGVSTVVQLRSLWAASWLVSGMKPRKHPKMKLYGTEYYMEHFTEYSRIVPYFGTSTARWCILLREAK